MGVGNILFVCLLAFFIFQIGKVTGSIAAGVIDLTLDDEDYGSSQGN